jgi:hypothetical protein
MDSVTFLLLSVAAQFDKRPLPHFSMQAESPFTSYTAAVTLIVLLVGFLVSVLLIGGFLIVNLGLLSKRDEDRAGGRTPSDVGILKHEIWPDEQVDRSVLPAEEAEEDFPDKAA